MRFTILLLGLIMATAGCSNSGHTVEGDEHDHNEGHAHHDHRFDEPEKYAERWNSAERAEWQKPAEVMTLMELEPGMTAVDLGAGTGYFVPYLAAEVAPDGKVLALDVEQAMIDWLEKQKKEKGWTSVTPQKVAFDDPQLEKQSVDRLLTVNTWHHIQNRSDYAKKLAEALKPGGMVVIVDYGKDYEGSGPPPEMRLDPAEIQADFAETGLQTEVVSESLPRQYVVIARKE